MFEEVSYDLRRIPYGRRGTLCYLGLWEEEGKEVLYVCTLSAAGDSGADARKGRLFPVRLERDGKEIHHPERKQPEFYFECISGE